MGSRTTRNPSSAKHLLDKKPCKQLSAEEAKDRQQVTKESVFCWLCDFATKSDEEQDFDQLCFARGYSNKDFRTPQFHGLPKFCQEPLKIQPVVSQVNSISQVLSVFNEHQLMCVAHLCSSCLQDSWQLLDALKALVPLLPASQFVTADATATRANAHTDHASKSSDNWFTLNADVLPKETSLQSSFSVDWKSLQLTMHSS